MKRDSSTLLQIRVSIPARLVEFFDDVTNRIADRDDEAIEESDDQLQNPELGVTGGLSNKRARQYSFTYFASEDPEVIWHLELFDNEIEDIGRRRIRDILMWKCKNESCNDLSNTRSGILCSCPLSRSS